MENDQAVMEKDQLLAINPSDYLAGGFFDTKGEMRERINGMYSLAMAYRLQSEGVEAEQIKKVTDKLEQTFVKDVEKIEADPSAALRTEAQTALQKAKSSPLVSKSATLSGVFDAAFPWLKDWKNLSAFVLHLERITEQMAILQSIQQTER